MISGSNKLHVLKLSETIIHYKAAVKHNLFEIKNKFLYS